MRNAWDQWLRCQALWFTIEATQYSGGTDDEWLRGVRIIRCARSCGAGEGGRGQRHGGAGGRHSARRSAQPRYQRGRDGALRPRRASHRGGPAGRPAHRRALPAQGPRFFPCRRQDGTGQPLLRRSAAGDRRQPPRHPAQAGRYGDLWQDEQLRTRPQPYMRAPALWALAQSLGPGTDSGGFKRRRCGCSSGPNAADRPCLGRVRLDPRACGLLRPGWPATDAGAQHDGALFRRIAWGTRHRKRGIAHGPRQRRAPRCHRWPWPRRSLCRAAACPPVSGRSRCRSRHAAHCRYEQSAPRRAGGGRPTPRPAGDRVALRRPRPSRRRGRPRDRRGRRGAHLPHHQRNPDSLPGARSSRWPDAPAGRS